MDISLFDTTIMAHKPSLMGEAMRLTKNDRAAAEDLWQEVALRAWRAFDRFDGRYAKAWLFRIMFNCYATSYGKQKRELRAFSLDTEKTETQASGMERAEAQASRSIPFSDAATEALKNIPDPALRSIMEEMNPKFAEALLLLADGYSYQEIAEMVDAPLGTVMSRIHRARDKATKKLELQPTL